MELSKMGPPLKSNTATISRRRRAASLRVSTGPFVESWLIGTKPPSIVVFLSVHTHLPRSPPQ